MAFVGTLGVFTPYSSVTPLISGGTDGSNLWAPESEAERIASYTKYEEMYWNNPTTFRLEFRGTDLNPIYIPNPRAICDMTSHFVMKGMELKVQSERDQGILNKFLKREEFYSRFHTAKHSGVVRGDYIFHMRADPNKPEGTRISLCSIDPASYFPVYSEDDPDTVLGIDIVDQYTDTDNRVRVLRQRYRYIIISGRRRVLTSLMLFEPDQWYKLETRPVKVITPERLLPETITSIPVYAFKNIDWQGQPYGSSELRGFERIISAINQSGSDEDISLALEGLGVYATTAPTPTNDQDEEEDWNISPGKVLEIPPDTEFKRVDGVGSVKPFQDHLKYLTDAVYESSATFRPSAIDAQVAQSGIALAIKFLPTLAKTEAREEIVKNRIEQLFFDWAIWEAEYENVRVGDEEGFEVSIILGDKLPKNKVEILNELNNALDRKVISKQYYREQLTVNFGYEFPDDIDQQILAEQKEMLELQQQFAPVQPNGSGGSGGGPSDQSGTKNRSNNKNKPNESGGTEAK